MSTGSVVLRTLDEEAVTEHSQLPYLITQVYWNYIAQVVDFSRIVQSMPFMRKISLQIMRGSGKENASLFLDHLQKSEELGKYQTFKEALNECGYQRLVRALGNEEHLTSKQHEHETLLREVFKNSIQDRLDAVDIANALLERDVLSHENVEEIVKIAERETNAQANFYLLDVLPHRSDQFYEIFLQVLFSKGHKNLVEHIDQKQYNMMTDKSDSVQELSSEMSAQSLPPYVYDSVDLYVGVADVSTPVHDLRLAGQRNDTQDVNSPPLRQERTVQLNNRSLARSGDEDLSPILAEILREVREVKATQAVLLQRLDRMESNLDRGKKSSISSSQIRVDPE